MRLVWLATLAVLAVPILVNPAASARGKGVNSFQHIWDSRGGGTWRPGGGKGADVAGSSVQLVHNRPRSGQDAIKMTYDMGKHVNYNYVVFNRLLRGRISIRGRAITFDLKAPPDTREPDIQLSLSFVDLGGNGHEKGAYSCTFSKSGTDYRTGQWVKLSLPLSKFTVHGHPKAAQINLIQFQATVYTPKSEKNDKGSFWVSRLRVAVASHAGKRK